LLLLLCLLQVVVRSLAEANRTDLLNSNITVVVPAPLPLQAEASGQQYNTSGEWYAASVNQLGTRQDPATCVSLSGKSTVDFAQVEVVRVG
jgi:hypothetical protein